MSPGGAAGQNISGPKAALFLVVTLLLPFLLLGLLEAGLRLGGYGDDTPVFESPDALGAAYLVPGQKVGKRYFPQERFPPTPPADAFLKEKPENALRIFVFGESSAAGFPFPANGTFSRVLRDALQDVLPAYTVEVVNLGMAATNSYTVSDLAGEVLEQKPDAVLIYGGHNEYYGALGAGSTETLGSFPGFVRVYLKLQRLRTFLLLRNAINGALAAVSGRRTGTELDASRMESVVRDQRITLGGPTYRRGVHQYDSNLRSAIETFRRAGVPVFIGSTPSNLRDLRPFGSVAAPPESSATVAFDSAQRVLSRGDTSAASRLFVRARDLDIIRFRAPGEFQLVVQKVARETDASYVPAVETFAREASGGIPGSDLFLEHVHPTQAGYVLLARAYFDALARAGFIGRKADVRRFAGWDEYTRRMRLTELDHRIAHHTVKTVTTRWPFVPVDAQLDYRGTYRPTNTLDSIAFAASRGGIPWARAKLMMGTAYSARGDTEAAVAEFEGLIRDAPRVEIAYRMAGQALLSGNQLRRAKPYLERAYALSPTGMTAFALGVIASREKDHPRAVQHLEQSLRLSPDMPAALYQLSLTYAVMREAGKARAAAARLAQIQPDYPGLAEWIATLSAQGQ